MLFVPGSRFDRIAKAAASAADAVCIDLEDSLTADEKEPSRANVVRAFTEFDFGQRLRMFRVNAVDTPWAVQDLAEVVRGAGKNIDLVMLPKVGSADDVLFVERTLATLEQESGLDRRIGIEAQIENAAGFVWLREIASSSSRLEALIFGPGDYSASMRMPSSGIGELDDESVYPGHRWHAVMHAIVAHARVNGLRCIDGPYAAFKDTAGFEKSCRIARSLGFDGKQCIHPSQLETANTVFAPTSDEIAHARRVTGACEQAARDGRGAATLDGKMIDAASVRMAEMVLEREARINRNP
jgi:citrate lyase beta subunit